MSLLARVTVVVRFVRQEGLAPAARRIVAATIGAIYRADRAYLLARSLDQPERSAEPRTPVQIHPLAEADVDRLAGIAYRSCAEIRDRLCAKQACLVAEKDGRVVHYSWLTSQPNYAREVEKQLRFDPEERYVYDCWTSRSARGQGIYPAVLARAIEWARVDGACRLLALVAANNASSLRAFEKAGFHVHEEIRLRRVLWSRRHRVTRYAPK
jgi:GNAT superfamily N-acetyltransferase